MNQFRFELIHTCAQTGAAVCRGGEVVRSKLSDNGLTHSETIMPLIDGLFDDEIKLCDMDAVCADVGPGSFTGVRIGVCIANAMAYALKLPVIEVSSLRALADAIDTERPVCALIDARNGNGYAALYENGKEIIAPKAVVVSELIAELPPNTVFTGDGARTYHDAIAAALPNAAFAAEEKHMLTADMLAKCADGKLERGETVEEARPLYLRPTQAERMYKAKEQQK